METEKVTIEKHKIESIFEYGKREGKKEIIEKLVELLELDDRYEFKED